jgi:hemolysin activation/secretion protein
VRRGGSVIGVRGACLVLAVAVLACSPALAQSVPPVSELEKRAIAEVEITSTLRPATTAAVPRAPGVASGLPAPRRIRLIGAPTPVASALENLIRSLEQNRKRAIDQIDLTNQVQQQLKAQDYALARPAVTVNKGRNHEIQVAIIDVTIEAVDTSGLPAGVASHVRRRLEPLIGKSFLGQQELVTALALIQFESGVAVKPDIALGSNDRTVRLVVTGSGRPYTGEVSLLGYNSTPVRRLVTTGAVTYASLLGLGDKLTIAATGMGRREQQDLRGRTWSAVASLQIPLAANGLFLETSLAGAQERRFYDTTATLDYDYFRVSARLGLPIFTTDRQSFIFRIGPDFVTEKIDTRFRGNVWPTYFNTMHRTSVVRAGLTWSRGFDKDSTFEATIEASAGRVTDDQNYGAPLNTGILSATHKSAAFGKIDGRFKADISLPEDFALRIQGQGQYGFGGPLSPNEQIQLLQIETVIPINPDTDQGDKGALLRLELARNFKLDTLHQGTVLRPYVFASRGFVYTRPDPSQSLKRVSGTSFGLGARMTIPTSDKSADAFEIGLEGYRQVTDGTIRNQSGINIRMATRF